MIRYNNYIKMKTVLLETVFFYAKNKEESLWDWMSLENFIEAEIQKRIEKKISELQPKEIIKEKEIIRENIDEQLKLYSVADIAKLWHIEQSKIRKLIEIGELKSIKFSKQGLKVTTKELKRFLEENEGRNFEEIFNN